MDCGAGPTAAVDEGLARSAALRLAAPAPSATDCANRSRCRGLRLEYDIRVYYWREGWTMLAIRLPSEIEQRLSHLAEVTGRTKTFYAREAILAHLEDLEDYYLAERVMERVRKGEERLFSLDEVERELGLES